MEGVQLAKKFFEVDRRQSEGAISANSWSWHGLADVLEERVTS
jgi:hypothetical protein